MITRAFYLCSLMMSFMIKYKILFVYSAILEHDTKQYSYLSRRYLISFTILEITHDIMTTSDPVETRDKDKDSTPAEEAGAGPVVSDQMMLATAGYDHTIKFWSAHTGVCTRTLQHPDSQVNSLAISGDGSMIAAGGYQHIRMFDLLSGNLNPVVNFGGVSKNVMTVGYQVTQSSHFNFNILILIRRREDGCSQEARIVQPGSGIST